MENLDHRSLVSLKAFFKALDDAQATIRIVDEERDRSLILGLSNAAGAASKALNGLKADRVVPHQLHHLTTDS